MLRPESPNLPPDDGTHRQLCAELLVQMAAGNGVAPYPFGDALYLLDGLGRRPPEIRPARRRGWLARLLATLRLTGAREERPMEPRGGGGSGGGARPRFADLPVRKLHA
jgi:hypothetical protein